MLAADNGFMAQARDRRNCCLPDPVLIFDPSFPSAEVFGGAYAEIHEEVVAEFEYATIGENKGLGSPDPFILS
jgi:hypothetical protein